jgi:DNA polymerase elongation subunit (family B)
MIEIARDYTYCRFKKGDRVSDEEVRQEIARLEYEKTINKNIDSALKVILNSIFGVVGFQGFVAYNKLVAETVTAQSQSLIKYTIKCINHYFTNLWSLDTKIHEILGLKETPPNLKNKPTSYADTDSVMLCLEQLYLNSGYEGNKIDFFLIVAEKGLLPYLDMCLRKYIDSFNGFQVKPSGAQSFKLKLEQICESVLFVAKKKYVKNVIWDEGYICKPLENIQIKGLEMNQSSYPKFVRKKLSDVVEWILSQREFDMGKLMIKLRSIKDEFHSVDVSEICATQRLNKFEKYVLSDTTEIKLEPRTPEHVKASANFNHRLYNSKYKFKYKPLKSGVKVQFYISQDNVGAFGFPVGQYPMELAPPLDYDLQFKKIFLNPLNNILESLELPSVKSDLILFPSII